MRKIEIIEKWVKKDSKVLVLGCGTGDILRSLDLAKEVRGFGIDLDEAKVFDAISSGLSVIQGDINTDLGDYPEKSFDYVIAHDIVQIMKRPDQVIKQMLRLADRVIISFPNFGFIKVPFTIFFSGRMPKTKILPYEWYNTPNIHLFTIKDFREFCRKENIAVEKHFFTGFSKKIIPSGLFPNLLAEFAYFLISRA